jgi:hypothetical protein
MLFVGVNRKTQRGKFPPPPFFAAESLSQAINIRAKQPPRPALKFSHSRRKDNDPLELIRLIKLSRQAASVKLSVRAGKVKLSG